MNREAADAMTTARNSLLLDHPFFGILALRLEMVQDPTFPTAWVDGKSIGYNPEFFLKQTPSVRKSVVAHEVLHPVLQHCGSSGRNIDLLNMPGTSRNKWLQATDYAVNALLKDAGFELGSGWLYDKKYEGLTADAIYAMLPDDGNAGQDEVRAGQFSPAELEEQAVEWAIAVNSAAAAAAARGKLPGAFERFVQKMNAGKTDWRAVLRRFCTDTSKNDYNWMRPNRRMLNYGYFMPSLHNEAMGCLVAVTDDSGSIGNDILSAFSAEITAIRDSVRPNHTFHISCDAEVNHTAEFAMEDEFKIVSKGGGGTSFKPPFEWVAGHGVQPTCLVYLTDGYGDFPTDPPQYPVLWLMTTDVKPPWGEVVRIEA